MTFDRPALLVLAALAAALPWLFGRIRDRRVRVPVGTLLLYERALEILAARRAAEPRAVERKRLVDRRLVVETVALVALALAAAGPRLEGVGAAVRFGVVVDDSPSMAAHAPGLRAERLGEALAGHAEALLASTSDAPVGVTDGARWVEGALRARGVDATLLIADLPPRSPLADATIVLAGEGQANRGIVAAGVRDGEVLVRASAADIVLRVRTRDGARTLLEGPGPVLRALLPPGLERTPLTAEIARIASAASDGEPYRDALADDDVVLLEPPGAPIRVRGTTHPTPTALLRGLEAAGGALVGWDDEAEAVVLTADTPGEGPPPSALFAPGAPWVRHADVAAMSVHVAPKLFRQAPDPAWPLDEPWRPLLVDERGRMILGTRGDAARPRSLGIAIPLEMGAAATDWTTRPSFPLLLAEWLDAVAGESRGEWRAIGLLDARETEEANPLEAGVLRSLEGGAVVVASPARPLEACLAAVLPHLEQAASRSPRRAALAAASSTPLAPWLLLAAAVAALASWALTRDRRLGRVAVPSAA